MLDLRFRHVEEKDIDLLLMDRATRDRRLLDLLLNDVKGDIGDDASHYELVGARHSAATGRGESDLVLLLSDGTRRHALLIEDKIDAPAQLNQAERYLMRGEDGVAAGDWDGFSVILVAPQGYIDSDSEPYPHAVSYQRIREALGRGDEFAWRLLSDAINKQRASWQPNRDQVMTAFYDEVARTAKRMRVKAECKHVVGQSRAHETAWVEFRSPLAKTNISWKSNQGLVALCFSGWGGKEDSLKERIGAIPQGWYWRKWTGKVKTAYLCVDALDKVTDWEEASADTPLIVDALYKVQALYDFALELNNRVIDWKP